MQNIQTAIIGRRHTDTNSTADVFTVTPMNTSDFESSINQLESELTSSREKLHKEFKKLQSDVKSLQASLVEKNEQIAALKNQKNELIGFLDQAFAILDDPSHKKLVDDLCAVGTEVQMLLDIAKCDGSEINDKAPANGAASSEPKKSESGKSVPDEQTKKLAERIMKGVGTGAAEQSR